MEECGSGGECARMEGRGYENQKLRWKSGRAGESTNGRLPESRNREVKDGSVGE